jgi:uncharacterized membrane protein HdeD (DUF308 family)
MKNSEGMPGDHAGNGSGFKHYFFWESDPTVFQMVSYCATSAKPSWKHTLAGGIISIVVGLILYFEPALSLRIILYFFGIIAIIIAIVLLAAAAFFSRGSGPLTPVLLIIGLFFLVVGALAFWKPEVIGGFLSVIASAVLIIVGLGMAATGMFQGESVTRKILIIAGGIALALLGILAIFHADFTSILIIRLLGVFFIAGGLVSIAGAFIFRRREEKTDPGYIDATIVEEERVD